MTETELLNRIQVDPQIFGGKPILQEIVEQQSTITVLLPDGREVTIEPNPRLKPLPELEGHVPEGWKEALYARS